MECESFQKLLQYIIHILKFGQVKLKYIADFFAAFHFCD